MNWRTSQSGSKLDFESLEDRQLLAVDILANIDMTEDARFTPRDIHAFGDSIVVRGDDGRVGPEAWISDGTAAGTELLKDIRIGRLGSGPRDFIEFNGSLFFGANNGFNGYELWVSNGTRGTTNLIADIWPGAESGAPTDMVVFQDTLYFFANDGESGRELYKSDGTAIGTERVADSIPGLGGSAGEHMTVVGDQMFFVGTTDIAGSLSIWVSDGTAEGTNPVSIPEVAVNDINFLTPYGDRLLFESQDQLWLTDGTSEGTQQIDIGLALGGDISELSVAGSTIYTVNSRGLQAISADLSHVSTISTSADGMTTSDGKAYFWHANGFYVVGADNSPTQLLPFVSFFGTNLHSTFNVPGGMVFSVNRTLDQYEIWGTNGTTSGTTFVETVRDASSDALAGFQQIGDFVYFSATNGAFRESLWQVPAPTIEILEQPGIPGDVNGDDVVNVADIDAVFAAVSAASSDEEFDVNEDGDVTGDDANYIVEEILDTRAGDVDLNGVVDFPDFLTLSGNFGKTEAAWSDGDFNGDGVVDFSDFLALSGNFGFDSTGDE